MLANLAEYRRYSEDLLQFQEVFDDTAREFAARPQLSILSTSFALSRRAQCACS
jgi:hypothetical protein